MRFIGGAMWNKELEYTEEHLHHAVRWYGKSADQSGDNWASKTSMTPYVATSGDNTWGTVDTADIAKLFGADDTLETGNMSGDFNEVLVTANTSNTVYRCRIIWATGAQTISDAITANQYSEFMYLRASGDSVRKIMFTPTPVIGIDAKIWLQTWNATNDATITFFVGVHGYNFA